MRIDYFYQCQSFIFLITLKTLPHLIMDPIQTFIQANPNDSCVISELNNLILQILIEKSLPRGISTDEIYTEVISRGFQYAPQYNSMEIQQFCIIYSLSINPYSVAELGRNWLSPAFIDNHPELFPNLLSFEKELATFIQLNPREPQHKLHLRWCDESMQKCHQARTRLCIMHSLERIRRLCPM